MSDGAALRPVITVRDKTPEEKRFALAAGEISTLLLMVALVVVSQAFPFKSVKWSLIGLFALVMVLQTLKRPAMGLALLVFAAPALDVVQINFGPAINTETILALFLLFIWYRAHQLHGADRVPSPMSKLLLVYALMVLLSCFNGWFEWHLALFDLVSAAKNHLTFLLVLPVAFHTLRDRRDQVLVIVMASISLFLNFVQAIDHSWYAFVIGQLERRRANALIALQPNAFGAAVAMYLPLLIVLASNHLGSRVLRIWFVIVASAGFFSLILSLSRGAWMGAVVGLALAALYRDRKLLLVMIVAAATYQAWVPDQAVERAEATISDDDDEGMMEKSAQMRVEQYKSLPAMMEPRPIFGWGYKTFPFVFEKYGTLKRNKGAHSSYCQYGTEAGIIGLAMLGTILFSLVRLGFRASRIPTDLLIRWIGVGVMCGTIAMAVCMISGARWDPQKMFVFFWCFVAIAERETLTALLQPQPAS